MQRLIIPLSAAMLSAGVAVPILAPPAADHAGALEARTGQTTQDQAKAEQAKDLAIAAAELIGMKGLDGGCPEMRVSGGRFYQGETYAFIMDLKGVWRCFPPKPAAEGLSALEVQDPDGKLLVKEMNAQPKGKDGLIIVGTIRRLAKSSPNSRTSSVFPELICTLPPGITNR
jgi:hypothetical protein